MTTSELIAVISMLSTFTYMTVSQTPHSALAFVVSSILYGVLQIVSYSKNRDLEGIEELIKDTERRFQEIQNYNTNYLEKLNDRIDSLMTAQGMRAR